MTGFNSVRTAAPPQISLGSPPAQTANPSSAPERSKPDKPSGQHVPSAGEPIAQSADDAAKALIRPDEDTPTGPPPAFEASLLELETNLEIVIKRVEAAREKARIAMAVSPEPLWDQGAAQDITQPL